MCMCAEYLPLLPLDSLKKENKHFTLASKNPSRFHWIEKDTSTLYNIYGCNKKKRRKNGKNQNLLLWIWFSFLFMKFVFKPFFWNFKWTNYEKILLFSFNLSKAVISIPKVNSTGRFSAFSMLYTQLLVNAFWYFVYNVCWKGTDGQRWQCVS